MEQVNDINQRNKNNPDNVEISKDLMNVIKGNGYKEIEKGYFTKVPDIYGFLYKFDSDKTESTFLIINTNPDFVYDKGVVEIKNFTFYVVNSPTIEDSVEIIKEIAPDIIQTIQNNNNEDDIDLPYGYTRDENGEIVIVPSEADEVRKIFKMFPLLGSIRKVASQLRSNFSHVREILHDARYGEMAPSIIPATELKKVKLILYQNRKNKTTGKENKMAAIRQQVASGIRADSTVPH